MGDVVDILTTAGSMYVVALGLFMMLNVMGVVNLAHGAFLTVGAYASVATINSGLPYSAALPLAAVVGALLGLVTERLLIRRLYTRPLDTILATWGLAIVITQMITLQWGRAGQLVPVPFAKGPIEFLGAQVAGYRVVVLGIGVGLALALYVLTRFTYVGVIARGVIMNPDLARALGINTVAVNTITFALASALVAFGGAVVAPLSSVDPNLGFPYVIVAFMVVLLAGASLGGLIASALVIAAGTTLAGSYISPVMANCVLVLVPVIALRFRPAGLAGLSLGRLRLDRGVS